MKFLALLLALGTTSAFALEVSGTLNNFTTKPAVVAVYAEYTATRALPGCKNIGIPDGQYSSHFKTKQRLVFVTGNNFRADVVNSFGMCEYTLRHSGVLIVDPAIKESMKRMGASEVEKNVYEFKGGLSGLIRTQKGSRVQNTLNCVLTEYYTAKCDKTEVVSSDNKLELSVHLDQ